MSRYNVTIIGQRRWMVRLLAEADGTLCVAGRGTNRRNLRRSAESAAQSVAQPRRRAVFAHYLCRKGRSNQAGAYGVIT